MTISTKEITPEERDHLTTGDEAHAAVGAGTSARLEVISILAEGILELAISDRKASEVDGSCDRTRHGAGGRPPGKR